jgi:hypothetical protein
MYATNADAPADVRDRFKGHCLYVWRTTWNDTMERHGDEGRAFATAETAGSQCMEAGAMDNPNKSVQFVKGSPDLIEGLAIPWGGPLPGGKDLDGEYFDKSTDLALDWFTERPLLFDHGVDGVTKASVIGRQVKADITDEGVWVQAHLDRNSRYRTAVGKLIENDALSFSSGAMAHLARIDGKSGHIERWPWVELSLTATPANPSARVYQVKSTDAFAHLAAMAYDGGDGGSEHDPYAEHGQRVLADVTAFVERTHERQGARGKVGRVLSAANRELLNTYLEQLDALSSRAEEIRALLRETDPSQDKAALAAFAEFAALEARLAGVTI